MKELRFEIRGLTYQDLERRKKSDRASRSPKSVVLWALAFATVVYAADRPVSSPPSLPRILEFIAKPGGLCYEIADADRAEIDQGVGPVLLPAMPGKCISVPLPPKTTTYILTAMGPGGTVQRQATISPAPVTPINPSSSAPTPSPAPSPILTPAPTPTPGPQPTPSPQPTPTPTPTPTAPAPPPPPAPSAPRIVSFLARPDHVSLGAEFAQVNLCYVVANATGAQIDSVGRVPLPAAQERCVSVSAPSQTTRYTLTAFGPGGRADASVSVTVVPPPPPRAPSPPVILSFLARPDHVSLGAEFAQVNLCYVVANATGAQIDSVGRVPLPAAQERCVSVSAPSKTTRYTLTAFGPGGRADAGASVTVGPPPGRRIPGAAVTAVPAPISPLRIVRFVAQPEALSAGQTGRLCYGVAGAVRTKIDPGAVQVAPVAQNCVSIGPRQSTQYTLTATGPDGRSVSQSVVVKVAAPPPPR